MNGVQRRFVSSATAALCPEPQQRWLRCRAAAAARWLLSACGEGVTRPLRACCPGHTFSSCSQQVSLWGTNTPFWALWAFSFWWLDRSPSNVDPLSPASAQGQKRPYSQARRSWEEAGGGLWAPTACRSCRDPREAEPHLGGDGGSELPWQ